MAKYRIDPELAAAMVLLPDSSVTDIPTIRADEAAFIAGLRAPDLTGVLVEERLLPAEAIDAELAGLSTDSMLEAGPAPAAALRVRIYRPSGGGEPAGLLHLHPGGFVGGDLDIDHAWKVELTRSLGITIVSVDYRLAPEHRYPAALLDCYRGLRWFADQADDLGIDRNRIGVIGQSAGGGLAAALALLARDRGGPAICLQVLVQPELDDRLNTPSMRAFTDTPVWNLPRALMSWQSYLGGQRHARGDVPCYAAPSRATDLAGLPPAYLSVAEFDPLRDEGINYASALLQAGVRTELHVFPGTFHGSSVVQNAPVTQRENAEILVTLREALIR
ncbi:MAG: alpha/beta hydrolase [Jatrophihabitantaceae bacterium]